jgi:hypothetical protein
MLNFTGKVTANLRLSPVTDNRRWTSRSRSSNVFRDVDSKAMTVGRTLKKP